MRKLFVLIVTLLISYAPICNAWTDVGHETIVELAKRHLTPKAKAGIARYMPYDITLDARWMDRHRSDSALLYMYHFHEQCINLETLEYDPNAQVDKGDIMRGLWLADYNLSHRESLSDSCVVLNIRMLLHFVADLHCPVHLGVPGIWFPKPPYRLDLGKWYYRGEAWQSFHKFIDTSPKLLFPDMTPARIAAQIDTVPRRHVRSYVQGDFVAWTNDAAKRGFRIYEFFPPLWEIPDSPEPKYIPDDFLNNTKDIITEELLKAGYQLAFLLNKYFNEFVQTQSNCVCSQSVTSMDGEKRSVIRLQ